MIASCVRLCLGYGLSEISGTLNIWRTVCNTCICVWSDDLYGLYSHVEIADISMYGKMSLTILSQYLSENSVLQTMRYPDQNFEKFQSEGRLLPSAFSCTFWNLSSQSFTKVLSLSESVGIVSARLFVGVLVTCSSRNGEP